MKIELIEQLVITSIRLVFPGKIRLAEAIIEVVLSGITQAVRVAAITGGDLSEITDEQLIELLKKIQLEDPRAIVQRGKDSVKI